MKPTTIDEIHENARQVREQEERDQERERQQRRDQNRGPGGPQQYSGRGSGMKQQSNRNEDDRTDNRLIVDSLRQYQSNDKKNPGQLVKRQTH